MNDALKYWQEKIQSPSFLEQKLFFQKKLVEWFKQNGRDLPWRRTRDPYSILISELMLQQTQVDRVAKDYYFQFLKRFPTIESIAKSTEDDVVKMWEGLGYYNRARNLYQLSLEVMEKYKGQFPKTREEIIALPGIGEYTAGAVMSFGLGIRAPIVDTNVNRVYTRVFILNYTFGSDSQKDKVLWLLAEALLPENEFWEFNQGIMDLGATVCILPNPNCNKCPMQKICQFYNRNSLTRFFNK